MVVIVCFMFCFDLRGRYFNLMFAKYIVRGTHCSSEKWNVTILTLVPNDLIKLDKG